MKLKLRTAELHIAKLQKEKLEGLVAAEEKAANESMKMQVSQRRLHTLGLFHGDSCMSVALKNRE